MLELQFLFFFNLFSNVSFQRGMRYVLVTLTVASEADVR